MKDTIQEITTAVDALMVLASKFDRGQLIGWNDIEAIIGDRNEGRAKYTLRKWYRRLEREREIVTLVAPSTGVRLLTHLETAREIPAMRQRRAYRQVRRAIKQTALVDVSQLRDHDRRLLVAQRQNMAEQRRELNKSQRQLREGLRPTETNPRRKPLAT